jgi:hypothetical protein
MRIFHDQLLPVFRQHGSRIGEAAFYGDLGAEAIIHRYKLFHTTKDPENMAMLGHQLKTWLKEHEL